MRILYGVQGTGNGHLTRARVVAPALARAGIEVDYLFSGRDRLQPFGDFRCYQGLTFATSNGQIQLAATALNNNLWRCWRDIQQLDLSRYDLVLNDFEPISAWAARRQQLTCIGISHQNAFLQAVPITGDSPLNQLILRYFAPATVALGCHWHHFGCQLLPPFVEPITAASRCSGRVLVYLPFEHADAIVALLNALPQQRFSVFHGSQPNVACGPHVQWHGFSRDGFAAELRACAGVIASAGFELASEALVLGKKLLLKPLQGQFEQLSNALALELLGVATVINRLEVTAVNTWLAAPSIEPIGYPPVADTLVRWLLAGDWGDIDGLCQQAWQPAKLPDSWQHKWATAY
ncbi:MJ1255/VC2487 family glycosyltransferase [Ferrimonas senticii]|uniref:MJ1255/VC2487 family glycosyltransferase n=1 Tax=Ferrimonas senticii TaxID=394566 RepID=UPI0003F51F0C|nr:MJ1255/VC2487 family glycosyltransferase [Ferrimonas senticii]